MKVVGLRRGWRLNMTDNEFELLRVVLARGLQEFETTEIAALPWKLRKVIESDRWRQPNGPLTADEARREIAMGGNNGQ